MGEASDQIFHDYIRVLECAILDMRMRIRYEDDVSLMEVHDLLDAIHNIPIMLRSVGGWHIPENIDADLARYDSKWQGADDSKRRKSLIEHLNRIQAGDYDHMQ